jgi:hypothetical protein
LTTFCFFWTKGEISKHRRSVLWEPTRPARHPSRQPPRAAGARLDAPCATPRGRRASVALERDRRDKTQKTKSHCAGLAPQKAPQKNQTKPTMGHRSLTSPHTPSLFSSILLTAAALDPPGDSRRVSPRGCAPSTRPACDASRPACTSRSRTRSSSRTNTKNQRIKRPSPPPQKKPNKSCQGVASAPVTFCAASHRPARPRGSDLSHQPLG